MLESDGLNDFIFVLKIFEYDIDTFEDDIGTFECRWLIERDNQCDTEETMMMSPRLIY